MAERYYTPEEVAEMYRLNSSTIRRWIRAGQLAALQPGRDYRIPESEVVRLGQPLGTER